MDNFKQVNDTLGHLVGDQLLVKFSDLLTKKFRKTDTVCRLGGDEFLIFLPKMNSKELYWKNHKIYAMLPTNFFREIRI
jgi:diguanylate cyclase (GGDEF)-like protein